MGKPAPHCNHTVVDAHMAELPDELKETFKRSLRNGIFTGIERPEKTTSAKASMTATQHAPAVWKQMRKFVQHGWVRAFPAELRDTISTWALLVSPTHYVADQDRLVADLSNSTSLGEGKDPNSLSSHDGYDKSQQVQCDYIDVVAVQLVEYLQELGDICETEVLSLKADIKSAFMRVPLDVRSVGTMALEWDGWIFVFTRTPFGWKYATHTFSPFTKAVKLKINALLRNGWTVPPTKEGRLNAKWSRVASRVSVLNVLAVLPRWQQRAKLRWKDFLAFAYVDDLWAFTSQCHVGGNTKKLAQVLRVAGHLLLGYDGWSKKEAIADGFFSAMHKYTGMGFNLRAQPEPNGFFTMGRIQKNNALCGCADKLRR